MCYNLVNQQDHKITRSQEQRYQKVEAQGIDGADGADGTGGIDGAGGLDGTWG